MKFFPDQTLLHIVGYREYSGMLAGSDQDGAVGAADRQERSATEHFAQYRQFTDP